MLVPLGILVGGPGGGGGVLGGVEGGAVDRLLHLSFQRYRSTVLYKLSIYGMEN